MSDSAAAQNVEPERSTAAAERAAREKLSFDEGVVLETSLRWHTRFDHVFAAPNTKRLEATYVELVKPAVAGRTVLELGSGDGENGERLIGYGARHVLGIDVAESYLRKARQRAVPGRLEFRVGDAAAPIEGRFGAIVGRAVLHHIDYRDALPRLVEDNLEPGGALIFLEPLADNFFIRLFTRMVPKAHTPDERSFTAEDLAWFEKTFAKVEFYPFNYATLPLAMATTFIFRSADNFVLRAADRFDTWLARRSRSRRSHFRQAVIVVRKPA
jgi:SAM-dependent methyltransferase